MINEKRSALVIGAHFDDCECGSAAGTSIKLMKSGWRVVFLNTIGNHSAWAGSKKQEEKLIEESHAAAQVIGAEKIFLNYKHNQFMPEDRDAVAAVAKVIQAVNPEIIFIPWPHDNHYDHARTASAAMEALSYINRFAGGKSIQINLKEILAYEISTWQTYDFAPDFFVNIDNEIESTLNAIRTFNFLGDEAMNQYVEEKRARSRIWGVGAGVSYAEGLKHLGPMFPVKSILPEIFGNDLIPAGSIQYPWGKKFF
jgi:LmbE family N-acetylglucosaminyl deacetylase